MEELRNLVSRLSRIGIEIELVSNVPWVYITKVNGNLIDESDFTANHGFVIGWIKEEFELVSDKKRIFEIIRKYR